MLKSAVFEEERLALGCSTHPRGEHQPLKAAGRLPRRPSMPMFFSFNRQASAEHAKYCKEYPSLPISKNIFYESRCACIKEAEFEECACPEHTLMCAAFPLRGS